MARIDPWCGLVYLSQQDDGVSNRLRQTRRTLDGAIEALAARWRGAVNRCGCAPRWCRTFSLGSWRLEIRVPMGCCPPVSGRIELSTDEPQHWPPTEGQYDANGLTHRLGDGPAGAGDHLRRDAHVSHRVDAGQRTEPRRPTADRTRGRKSMISVVSSLGLDLAGTKAWRRLFSADPASGSTASTAPAFRPPHHRTSLDLAAPEPRRRRRVATTPTVVTATSRRNAARDSDARQRWLHVGTGQGQARRHRQAARRPRRSPAHRPNIAAASGARREH